MRGLTSISALWFLMDRDNVLITIFDWKSERIIFDLNSFNSDYEGSSLHLTNINIHHQNKWTLLYLNDILKRHFCKFLLIAIVALRNIRSDVITVRSSTPTAEFTRFPT